MSFFDDPPLHDFPDRAIRLLQAYPAHLRELVEAVAPGIAPRLEFERARSLERDFPLPDWRRREADLLFHVPFRSGEPARETLLCLLIEHQSAADPPMPLRTLWYAVLYWEREWRTWSDRHPRGTPLRLNPVLPIILHTGAEPWSEARELHDMMAGPTELQAFVPDWRPLFWDLAEQTPEALLERLGEWLPALAVVRAEQEDAERYRAVLGEVLKRLEPLYETDKVRWSDLLCFLLSWGLRRRSAAEQQSLYETVLTTHQQAASRQEIEHMAQKLGKSWADEMLERGIELGRAKGKEEGKEEGKMEGRIEELRYVLLRIGRKRFGEPDEATLQALGSITDIDQLERMCDAILDVTGWAEFVRDHLSG